MRIIADLHIHSKYSRACSQDLTPRNIGAWADKKGISIVGTGDFTHPKWLSELRAALEETRPGLYQLRDRPALASPLENRESRAYFMLTGEISSIYKQGDKVRRIHTLMLVPNFAAADRLVAGLEKRGANLKADGRPITGIRCEELAKIAQEADPGIAVIPAHAWTPHFGVFGSLSGFDALEEAFGSQTGQIFAIETGLSSDPKMNWQIPALDRYALISNSDAHSLRKIGREANVFEVDPHKLSYSEIIRIIKAKNPREFLYTLEFFPEEGKYHLDGHRDCKFSCEPAVAKKLKGLCPVCGKKLLVGVLSRVDELASREYGFKPRSAVPYRSIVPLEEIIAETLGVGPASKKVAKMYEDMTGKRCGEDKRCSEFAILLDLDERQIAEISSPAIAQSVIRVREGRVRVEGGFDGVFGKIHIFEESEKEKVFRKPKQEKLFE